MNPISYPDLDGVRGMDPVAEPDYIGLNQSKTGWLSPLLLRPLPISALPIHPRIVCRWSPRILSPRPPKTGSLRHKGGDSVLTMD